MNYETCVAAHICKIIQSIESNSQITDSCIIEYYKAVEYVD